MTWRALFTRPHRTLCRAVLPHTRSMTWQALLTRPLLPGRREHQQLLLRVQRGQVRQGLTLVHFSAQPQPFWSHRPASPSLIDWENIMHPTYPTKCAHIEQKA